MFGRHSGNRTVPTLGLHLEIDRTLLAKMSQRDQFQLDVIFKWKALLSKLLNNVLAVNNKLLKMLQGGDLARILPWWLLCGEKT